MASPRGRIGREKQRIVIAEGLEILREGLRGRFEQGVLVGTMSLWDKQKDLRTGNEIFFQLADHEKRKYQNS